MSENNCLLCLVRLLLFCRFYRHHVILYCFGVGEIWKFYMNVNLFFFQVYICKTFLQSVSFPLSCVLAKSPSSLLHGHVCCAIIVLFAYYLGPALVKWFWGLFSLQIMTMSLAFVYWYLAGRLRLKIFLLLFPDNFFSKIIKMR